ncbi:serpin family protein [Arthrobacter sp. H-02-3]|uniref:serpin family protein n=1 Tax=Arthrobacter sp. H-02-3 TaxID=2703675 RepID=UPI000DD1CF51|nr:serpin family protein [Arthrobacter sp. H-02-3]PVZ56011.1 proteinase inhibitor I4 serpin [Arthrobacter sp. H-02-3]
MAGIGPARSAGALAAYSPPPPALLTADGVDRVRVDRFAYAAELEAFRASALTLGAALLADGGEESAGNVVSSPGSLLIALAMLRAGASGETAVEMDKVLGLPAGNRDEAMNALLGFLAAYDGDPGSVDEKDPPRKPVMHAANGLFVDKGVPTRKDYLATLAKHYGTGVYPVDFQDEAATKPAIDAWVNKNTGGRIKKAPAEYDRDCTFSLLNALYFAAAWLSPFDPNDTQDSPFTKSGGEEISVPTMHNMLELAYAEGAGWRVVDLPYAKGFVMRLVLPGPGEGPETLTAATLAEIAAALDMAPEVLVLISLPRWDHKSSFDLRKVLGSLGLNTTLTTTKDFDSIQSRLTITKAAQAASITAAEKGTVAAAVTRIDGMVTGLPPEPEQTIDFDRPFHYQIVHVESGLPLFMGTVADPR